MPPSIGNSISYIDRNMHSFFLAPTSSNECNLFILDLKNSVPTCIFKHISDLVSAIHSNLIIE